MRNYSNFNKALNLYLENRQLFYVFLRPQEACFFQEHMPFKKPVLDFGCGDGFFARVILGDKEKIEVGVDIDMEIKKEAEESGVYEKVVIYNGGKLPFENSSFSTIISNCVLEHVDDLEEVLKELNRVLKRDGHLVITVATSKWEENLLGAKLFGNYYKTFFRKLQHHNNLLSKAAWEKKLKSAGFDLQSTTSYMGQRSQYYCEAFHYLFLLRFPLSFFVKQLARSVVNDKRNCSLLFIVLKK